MSDNKDISSASTSDNNKTSLLSEDVQAILQRGMTEGFNHPFYGDGYLDLSKK